MFFQDFKVKPTISITQHMVHKGSGFRSFHKFTVAGGNAQDPGEYFISIQNGQNAVHLFNRLVSGGAPNMIYEVRTGATIDSYGDTIDIFNMNAYSNNVSANTARIATSVSDIGQLVDIHPLKGFEQAGNRLAGDESIEPDDIKVLPDDTEFLIRITNPNSDPADAFLYLKWFETAPPQQ